jgi:two-component system, NtrC family, response regulator AtoC
VPIDVRFLSATHRELPAEIAAGRFRRDLFYRLAGITLDVPPLRQRPARMSALALQFVAENRARSGSELRLSPAALGLLQGHSWPGNARELRNVIERAALIAGGREILPEHILFDPSEPDAPGGPPASSSGSFPASASGSPASGEPDSGPPAGLDAAALADRERIVAALEACGGNQTHAARQLGISRATIVHKVALYRIPRGRKR